MRLAPSLHRLGEEIVACYLLEEAGAVTIVDAGVPAYYGDLAAELAAMGRTIDDLRRRGRRLTSIRPVGTAQRPGRRAFRRGVAECFTTFAAIGAPRSTLLVAGEKKSRVRPSNAG